MKLNDGSSYFNDILKKEQNTLQSGAAILQSAAALWL